MFDVGRFRPVFKTTIIVVAAGLLSVAIYNNLGLKFFPANLVSSFSNICIYSLMGLAALALIFSFASTTSKAPKPIASVDDVKFAHRAKRLLLMGFAILISAFVVILGTAFLLPDSALITQSVGIAAAVMIALGVLMIAQSIYTQAKRR